MALGTGQKAILRIVQDLEQQGCRFKRTTKGYMVLCPSGDTVTIHLTESDARAMRNTRSRIKRAGLVWPLDQKKIA